MQWRTSTPELVQLVAALGLHWYTHSNCQVDYRAYPLAVVLPSSPQAAVHPIDSKVTAMVAALLRKSWLCTILSPETRLLPTLPPADRNARRGVPDASVHACCA